MQGIFHDGGWGMYPTTIMGLVLLAAAIRYARDPNRRRFFLLRQLNMLVLLSGTLGTVTGVIKTFTNMGDQLIIAFIGVGESLNNLALALGIMILARIIIALGAARDGDTAGELVNPPGSP